ncbi:hypothetical protein GF412_05640 [Candidatus Micrarchaeota archaeon]|nr:hypothetical protein [Candidatus Micrarchaeota archaeon]
MKDKKFNEYYSAFTNNGVVTRLTDNKEATLEIRDLLTSRDATRFIPQVVQTIIREALEPNLMIVPNLFQEVRMERGQQIQLGALGAMQASEIPEGAEYPQVDFDVSDKGDMIAFTTSKHGLMIRVTEEVIQDNQWDVMGLWMRAAGKALARHKEQYAIRLLDTMGVTIFDNTTPSNGQLGTTTGRGIDGAQNGSMSTNDMFDMYAYLLHRGFTPDTVLMHPLAWRVFMCDAEMREIVLKGATLASRRLPNGSPASAWGTGFNGQGLRTTATGTPTLTNPSTGNTEKIGASAWLQTLNGLAASFNIAPRYLPTPLTVLVTPYIAYTAPVYNSNASKGKTSIVMTDSSNCGLLITKQGVENSEFTDPMRDIRALKVNERYGFGLLEQGKSVAVADNISIVRNYNFENVNNVTLDELTTDTAV